MIKSQKSEKKALEIQTEIAKTVSHSKNERKGKNNDIFSRFSKKVGDIPKT